MWGCTKYKKKLPPGQLLYEVKKGDIVVKVNMTGTIEPYVAIDLKSRIDGRIERLLVDKGDRVKKGDTLIEIDKTELTGKIKEAETNLSLAELSLTDSKIRLEDKLGELEKQKELFEKGIVARRKLEIAQKDYDLIVNQHKSDEARLSEAKQKYESIKEKLTDAVIASPISGTVLKNYIGTKEKIATGEIIAVKGMPLLNIGNLEKFIIKTSVNEIDIGKIKTGQQVDILLEAVLEKRYKGKITEISLDAETRTEGSLVNYPVNIEILNTDEKIIPSMTAYIEAVVDKKEDVLYVPIEAVIERYGEKGTDVFEGGKTVFRPVETGINDGNYIEITSGLNENNKVVLTSESDLD
jgi:RND family efflux transporter MFP subunit